MRPQLFVDSGAWIALSDQSDQHHAAAVHAYPTLLAGHQIITTNLVVAESYNYFQRCHGTGKALTFLQALRQSARIEIAYSDPERETEAVDILRRYNDQTFSYTDAVSFAYMRTERINLAFAFDAHFDIAGFERLPKSS